MNEVSALANLVLYKIVGKTIELTRCNLKRDLLLQSSPHFLQVGGLRFVR